MHMLKVYLLLCSLVLIVVFFRYMYISKKFCSINYVLLEFFILSYKSIWCLLSSLSITPRYFKFSTLSDI